MKNQRVPQRSTLALAVTLALAGCGGGGSAPPPAPPATGGSNPPPVSTTLTGVVVDGYVRGATVWLDQNNNNAFDAGEPSAVTGADGHFTLAVQAAPAQLNGQRLRVAGGTDLSTGKAFASSMNALVEDAASKPFVPVSPLSTVIEAMVASGAAPGLSQARENMARVLGMSSVAALDKDPLAIVTTEKAVLQKMVALQKAMEVLAVAEKGSAETGTAAALQRVAQAVAA